MKPDILIAHDVFMDSTRPKTDTRIGRTYPLIFWGRTDEDEYKCMGFCMNDNLSRKIVVDYCWKKYRADKVVFVNKRTKKAKIMREN